MKLGVILFLSMISTASYANVSNNHYEPLCINVEEGTITHTLACSDGSRKDRGSNDDPNQETLIPVADVLISSYKNVGEGQVSIKGKVVNKSKINNLFLNDEYVSYDRDDGSFDIVTQKNTNGIYRFALFFGSELIKELSYFSNGDIENEMIVSINSAGASIITNYIRHSLNTDTAFIGKNMIPSINKMMLEKLPVKVQFNDLNISIQDINITPLDNDIISLKLVVSNLYFSIDLLGFTATGVAGPIEIKSTINLNDNKSFSTQDINIQTVIFDNQDIPGVSIGAAITSSWIRLLVNDILQDTMINMVDSAVNNNLTPLISDMLNETYSLNVNNTHHIDFKVTKNHFKSTMNDLSLYGTLDASPRHPKKETLIRYNGNKIADIKNHDYNVILSNNTINEMLYSFFSGGFFNLTSTKDHFFIGKDFFDKNDIAKINFLTLPWAAFNPNENLDSIEINAEEVEIHMRIENETLIDLIEKKILINGSHEINEFEKLIKFRYEGLLKDPKGNTIISAMLAVKLNAHIEIKNSKLILSLTGVNKISINEIHVGELNIPKGLFNEFNSAISEFVVENVNKVLLNIMQSFNFPEFNCLALKDIKLNNGKDSHFNMGINIDKISESCDIDFIGAPKVFYGRLVGIVPTQCKYGDENSNGLCYPKCKSGFSGDGPLCWNNLKEYGRGAGKIPTDCGAGKERDGGLCYPVCKKDYHGVGPVCWANKAKSYGRGVGTIPSNIFTGRCPSGKENNAGLCYRKCNSGYYGSGPVCWLNQPSYGRGAGKVANECGDNKENDGGLCYPKCKAGYNGIGPMCWQKEISYGRNVGKMPICDPSKEKDAGLCYKPCLEGYKGVGPICHPK